MKSETATRDKGRLLLMGLVLAGAALRLAILERTAFEFDEAFTAVAARRPLGDLLGFLRHNDAHPPLDYLMRMPLARAGVSEWTFRLPSAAASIGVLAVFGWWMRRYGALGLAATAAIAVSSYQLTYSEYARMYAPVALCGAVACWAADRWLDSSKPAFAGVAGAAVAVGAFLSSGALLFAAGMVLLPGLRRDRGAVIWRAAIGAAVGTWAVVWGPSFLDQVGAQTSSWIPFTTPRYVVETANELIDVYPTTWPMGLGLALVGGFLLARREPRLARIALCALAVPFALGALAGMRYHVFLPRTFAPGAPMILVALAAVPLEVGRRWRALAVPVAAFVAVLLVPSAVHVGHQRRVEWEPVVQEALGRSAPGDAIGAHPGWLTPIVEWRGSVDRAGPEWRRALPGLDTTGFVLDRPSWSGRAYVVAPESYPLDGDGYRPCGSPRRLRTWVLYCLERPGR